MINAKLTFPLLEQSGEYDVKVSLYHDDKYKKGECIKNDALIECDPHFLEVIDVDFEFNGEPYYESYDFVYLKIQTLDRAVALLLIDERYNLLLVAKKEDNKSLKEDIAVILNNCSVYQLKNKEVIVKPASVNYL